MSYILDNFEKEESTPPLEKNWNDLQVLFGILLIVTGILSLFGGLILELEIHELNPLRLQLTLLQELRLILILIIVPIAIIISSVLLFMKKRIGWIMSTSSALLITILSMYIGYNVPPDTSWITYLISFVAGLVTIGLTVKAYRNYYDFKVQDILWIAGAPTVIVFITIYQMF